MPPASTAIDNSLYEVLPLKDDDNETYTHHGQKPRRKLPQSLLYILLAVQAFVVIVLLVKVHKPCAEGKLNLYSPAEDAVQYEVKTFVFGIGDDLSPFQQPPSPTLDQMWQDLYSFGISRIPKSQAEKLANKTSPIPGDPGYYIAEIDVFHQLHCLNMIRQALYPDYYPEMRLGNPKTDEHVNHCVDSVRQSLMCSSDISTIVWQWNDAKQNTTFRGNIAHKCRNFDLIREWAQRNTIQREFDQTVHIQDDFDVPIYRPDGSIYFP